MLSWNHARVTCLARAAVPTKRSGQPDAQSGTPGLAGRHPSPKPTASPSPHRPAHSPRPRVHAHADARNVRDLGPQFVIIAADEKRASPSPSRRGRPRLRFGRLNATFFFLVVDADADATSSWLPAGVSGRDPRAGASGHCDRASS